MRREITEHTIPSHLPQSAELSKALDAIVDFCASRPVFTEADLREVAPQHIALTTEALLEAVVRHSEDRGQQPELFSQPATEQQAAFFALDTLQTTAPEALPHSPDALRPFVATELATLFAGRSHIGEDELRFYLREVQGIGDTTPDVIGALVDDNLLVRGADGTYALPKPAPTNAPVCSGTETAKAAS